MGYLNWTTSKIGYMTHAKQVKSSFKSKKIIFTSKLIGPFKIWSYAGNFYMLVMHMIILDLNGPYFHIIKVRHLK